MATHNALGTHDDEDYRGSGRRRSRFLHDNSADRGHHRCRFDAVLFDAGGVFVLPDPTVLGPLLATTAATRRSTHRRPLAGMAAKSTAGGRGRLGRLRRRIRASGRCRRRRRGRGDRGARPHAYAPCGGGRSRNHGRRWIASPRAAYRWGSCRTPAVRSKACSSGDPARSGTAARHDAGASSTATSSASPSRIRRSSTTPSPHFAEYRTVASPTSAIR